MKLEQIIQPGAKVGLFPEEQPKNGERVSYESKISDLLENGDIEIYMPYEQMKLVLLSNGSCLNMSCFSKTGIYECRVRVERRYREGTIFYAALRQIGPFRRNQRREYYRLPCLEPMESRVMDEEEKQFLIEQERVMIMENLPMNDGTMLDIGGGGVRFVAEVPYEKNEMVCCHIHFGDEYFLCARILDVTDSKDQPGVYQHRAKFIGFDPREREKLIRYIFQLQRKKQKEKINSK